MAVDLEISPEEYFHLNNGRVLKNLYELLNALKSIDEETFSHHVNNFKNDFGNWAKHVFHEDFLAEQMFATHDREELSRLIEQRLFHSENKNFADVHNELPIIENFVESTTAGKIKDRRKEVFVKIQPIKHKHKLDIKLVRQPKPKITTERRIAPSRKQEDVKKEIILKEIPVVRTALNSDIPIHKINEILLKEKEIAVREKKIEEVESKIESELHELNSKKNPNFFNRDFNQGIAIGLLSALIIVLIYWKFFV